MSMNKIIDDRSTITRLIPVWLSVIIFGVCYYVAFRLGIAFRLESANISTFWIASGLYLATLLLTPYRHWPFFILVAALITTGLSLGGNTPSIVSIFSHLANLSGVLISAFLIRWFIADTPDLSQLKHILKFVLIIFVVTAFAALIGSYSEIIWHPDAHFWSAWQIWWFSDLLGILLITPVIISFVNLPRPLIIPKPARLIEMAILTSLVVFLSKFIFNSHGHEQFWAIDFPYILFPLLVWAALRFNTFLVSVFTLCIALTAVLHANNSVGPLLRSDHTTYQHVISIQVFLAIISFSALILSAIVHERKNALRKLTRSEESYRSFVRNSTEGIWRMEINPGIDVNLASDQQIKLIEENGTFAETNSVLREILKIDETVRPRDIDLETIFPFDNDINKTLLTEFIRSGYRVSNMESHRVSMDDKDIIMLTNIVGIVENDHLIRAWGTETDITAQRQAEESIRQKNELNSLITTLSTRFINLQGYEIDDAIVFSLKQITEFVGDEHSDIMLFSEDGSQVEKVYEWCAEGVEPHSSVLENISRENYPWLIDQFRNNNIIHVASLGDLPPEADTAIEMYQSLGIKSTIDVPLTSKGKFVGTLGFDSMNNERKWDDDSIALLRVIGEMFVSAIEKKKTEKAFLYSEEKFYTAFHASPDAISITTIKDGRIIATNQGVEKTTGYRPHKLTGKRIPDSDFWVNPADRDTLVNQIKEEGKVTNLLTKLRTREGNILDFSLSGARIEVEGEACMLMIARDISKQKQLEKTTRDQELQLIQADKMSSLGLMVSGMAHEVNNPNNLIQINATLLADMWPDMRDGLDEYAANHDDLKLAGLPYEEMRDTVPELITALHHGSKRIQAIVNNLKDFSRRGDSQQLRDVEINDVVNAACDLIRPLIKKKTDYLHLHLEENLPVIQGNNQQLEQVIVNLIINALDSLSSKDRSVTIETCLNKESDQLEIRVIDQGSGIPEDILTDIFEPFFTTKLDQGGTGLGLAVSYNLIKNHNGHLSVESSAGHGTEFLITLPTESLVTS